MKKTILILGATSMIARMAARAWAKRGHDLYIASRDQNELERIASDLAIRYDVAVKSQVLDVSDMESHEKFIQEVWEKTGGFQGVLLASGYMGSQAKALADFQEAKKIIDVNYVGACSILTHCANILAKQQNGFIAVITSVAGDRGRQSNYVYGSAKGGLNVFLEGLRNRLQSVGITVLTIKPGFVDTAMTYGRAGMFLVASPETIGEEIVKAVEKKKNVVYLPSFWRWIMCIIKSIPECLFKRLKL